MQLQTPAEGWNRLIVSQLVQVDASVQARQPVITLQERQVLPEG